MDIAEVLYNSLMGADPQVRAQAEAQMQEAEANHFVEYLAALTGQLANESQKTEVRMLAGIALKNLFSAKDAVTRSAKFERWISLNSEAKMQIKATALQALLSSDERVGTAAAQLVAAIANIELPRNEWSDLFQTLVQSTDAQSPDYVKKAALTAIGFICEEADPNDEALRQQSNGLLTAIVQGARKEEPSAKVREAALNALVLSLDFASENFKNQAERNYIMTVICDATRSTEVKVQLHAYAALNRVMAMFYEYMNEYMAPALFPITAEGMRSSEESVIMMALEFWSTVCEEETERKYNAIKDGSQVADWYKSHHFADQAVGQILPRILEVMTQQDEDAGDDEWNSSMSAASTLGLFAQCCGDIVVNPTLEFVSNNIRNEQWNFREASVMAFGSILEGPSHEPLKMLIRNALGPILELINDPSLAVKDTVAWCLGRIADVVVDGIDIQNQLPQLIAALISGLKDDPKVATNCCWALINLNEQLQESPDSPDSIFSPYYPTLFPTLIEVSTRPDNEASSRTSAYEALSSLVIFSSADAMNPVLELSGIVVGRLNETIPIMHQFAQAQPSAEGRNNLEELQSSLLGLLANIIRRVDKQVLSGAEAVMTMCIQLLEQRLPNSLIDEDVFVVIGATAGAIGEHFTPYIDAFMPYLYDALRQSDQPISHTAVGLVSDFCIAIGKDIERYAAGIMEIFVKNISKAITYPKLKPAILSCIGDIAGSIEGSFIPYLEATMRVLGEASSLRPDASSSLEFIDYILSLRGSIIEAYTGIVTGLSAEPAALLPYIQQIFGFLSYATGDEDLIKNHNVASNVAGLVGDIASMYPNGEVSTFFKEDWLTEFLKRARDTSIYPEKTVQTAVWARQLTKQQRQF